MLSRQAVCSSGVTPLHAGRLFLKNPPPDSAGRLSAPTPPCAARLLPPAWPPPHGTLPYLVDPVHATVRRLAFDNALASSTADSGVPPERGSRPPRSPPTASVAPLSP